MTYLHILSQVRILCQYGKCKIFGNDNNKLTKKNSEQIKTEKWLVPKIFGSFFRFECYVRMRGFVFRTKEWTLCDDIGYWGAEKNVMTQKEESHVRLGKRYNEVLHNQYTSLHQRDIFLVQSNYGESNALDMCHIVRKRKIHKRLSS
jgi:hypothetical protein